MNKFKLTIHFILTLLISPALFATNGVVEINQACVAIGCFSGDGIGFPVEIDGSAGNSYRLTSDLRLANATIKGITIGATSSNITINLNGFSIVRVGCDNSDCEVVQGIGSGIMSDAKSDGITIKNGSIIGMGSFGIYVGGKHSEIRNIKTRLNGYNGIHTRNSSIITDCISSNNGHDGINSNDVSIIKNNISYENSTIGISARSSATIIDNTSYNNGTDGIYASYGSNVQRNIVYSNDVYGLNFNNSTQISYIGNVLYANGNGNAVNGGVNMGSNLCSNAPCPP